MAEAVLTSVLVKLAQFLADRYTELQAVHGQFEKMEGELNLMEALLRVADSKRNRNVLIEAWLNEVRKIAKRITNLIDAFPDKTEQNQTESSNWFRRTTTKITTDVKRTYKAYMDNLPGKIEGITNDLNSIYMRGIQMGIMDDLRALDDVDDPDPSEEVDDPDPSEKVADLEVVGLENDKGKIIEHLQTKNIKRRTVLSIVGTGGLGKTTLAQKVYKSAKLKEEFDCRAWLSISQKYIFNDLLREILYSVEPRRKKNNPPITDGDIVMNLRSALRGKRYLIILDDVWHTNLWEQLEVALPDPDNASRVIITTRSLDIAKAADCNTQPYELSYLSDAEGLALLFREAFQQHIPPENYCRDLLEVAERLMKKCGGLPLALVVLGGILRRRNRTYSAWSKVDETMCWHKEDGEKCMKILATSYEELPNHLKLCFLYFAGFPEDYKISGRQIMGMWMAEGFIPEDGGGTMMDRAEECLQELVQRCLIQVTKKSWNGYCKYCSMHDLLRDLAIRKANEKKFFTIFSQEEDVNNLAVSKPSRAALQFCTLTKKGVYSQDTLSLLCFGFYKLSYAEFGFGLLNYSGFRQLRVLTLENVDMTNFSRRWTKGLINLKYLGLRGCIIPPEKFKKFFFYKLLETIDLEASTVDIFGIQLTTPIKTINLWDVVIPTLTRVYGGCMRLYFPLKWDQHPNLQTIKDVWVPNELVVQLRCCINLRTLMIGLDGDLDHAKALKLWKTLQGVLRKTEQLVYFGITSRDAHLIPFGGTTNLPCHEKIQKLHLKGDLDICVPISIEMFPKNLTKLTLIDSKIWKDPMPILERLQCLRILFLGCYSYMGNEFLCSTRGFPNLEKLKLDKLYNLRRWDIEEGAMPILRHLHIGYCEMLHELPELQKVQTLQELEVIDPSDELRESIHKVDYIPSVRIIGIDGTME